MERSYIDLVMDNGELIRMEFKLEDEDQIYDDVENAMKRGDWLPVNNYDGASAIYMGMTIDRVNMRKVVATL